MRTLLVDYDPAHVTWGLAQLDGRVFFGDPAGEDAMHCSEEVFQARVVGAYRRAIERFHAARAT